MQDNSGFCPCVAFSFCDSLLRILLDSLASCLCLLFTVFVQFRHCSVYFDSYSHSSAVLPLTWPRPGPFIPRPKERERVRERREGGRQGRDGGRNFGKLFSSQISITSVLDLITLLLPSVSLCVSGVAHVAVSGTDSWRWVIATFCSERGVSQSVEQEAKRGMNEQH